MHRFLDELRVGLQHCDVSGQAVLVAVSGGADSVALLRGLIDVASDFCLDLSVAHLNHRLRGFDSDADSIWVQQLATSFHLQCEVGEVSENALSAGTGGIEENARTLRHRFLDEAALKLGCRTIALAHTSDDQAETVLHRLFRGTGITGLRGMSNVRQSALGNRLVRPMLNIRKACLEEYLQSCGQSFRTDVTNRDTAMTRNRLRHVILPMLRDQINPQVDTAICRLAEQAAEIDEFVRQSVDQLLVRTLKDSQPDVCRLDVKELAGQSRHLVRELFHEVWLRQKWPLQAMGFEQWNRLFDTLKTRETITLPNRIEARYHTESLLVLRRL